MSTALVFDDETSRLIETIYTTSDVAGLRHDVCDLLQLQPGEHVLDVGSGPGLLALEMAGLVAPTGAVVGVDMSEPMLAMGRARVAGHLAESALDFQVSDARRLPFPDGAFDVAVATQTYEYIDDLPVAFAELARVVRPGGRVLVLDTDWDSIAWHSGDRARMERVLAVWNEHLVDPYLPRTLQPLLRAAGFEITDVRTAPLFNPIYSSDTYSFHVIDLIAAFVKPRWTGANGEVEAWVADLRRLGAAGTRFFSLNRYIVLAEKPA